MSFSNFDKSVPVVTKTDSLGRPFEINEYLFYLRNDALYDESGNMVADLSIDNNRTSKNAQVSPSLKDVLIEGLGGEKKGFEDYSIFGCSKEEVQKLYIQSVIESMASGKTVEVSRWVNTYSDLLIPTIYCFFPYCSIFVFCRLSYIGLLFQ
jgi:hypothetical protein